MAETVTEVPGALEWLHARYFAPVSSRPASTRARPPISAPALDSDQALLEKIRGSKAGGEFGRLWAGDAGEDASAADFRLCCILAFWTGKDAGWMDRLFRQSGLYQNEGRASKWDRKHHSDGRTYGAATIDKAIDQTRQVYQGASRTRAKPTPRGSRTLPPPQEKPLIRIVAGELPQAVRAAMGVLKARRAPIYQRGIALVRPIILERPRTGKAGYVPSGALLLESVEEAWLSDQITQSAQLEKFDNRAKEWRRCDCPSRLATTLLALAGEWQFPPLTGIVEAPTLRDDGSLLAESGYDESTGLYLHLPPGLKVTVPSAPTLDNAIFAFKTLEKEILAGFPFASYADLAVILAAILTALVRRQLRTAPGFVFDSPAPGSGKTLLADVVAILATGRTPPLMNQGKSDEETEKRLASFLLQGHGILNLDNVAYRLGGDLLCSLLTSPEINPRILGESRSPSLPTNLTLLATGNNVQVSPDLERRLLSCRLDPGCEHPEARRFDRDLHAWLPEHRGEMLSAALTILKAFHHAGLPKQDLVPYGSFTEWSAKVRSAVVWIGLPDPCQTRTRLEGADEATRELGAVLAAWERELKGQKLTLAEVRERSGRAIHAELRAALLAVAEAPRSPGDIDSRRLSHWLRKVEGRVVKGLRLVRQGEIRNVDQWAVEAVQASRDVSYAS